MQYSNDHNNGENSESNCQQYSDQSTKHTEVRLPREVLNVNQDSLEPLRGFAFHHGLIG